MNRPKPLPRPLFAFCTFLILSLGTLIADPLRIVPAGLEVAATQSLALTLTAKGVQIYQCRPVQNDPNKFEWAFEAPEATLYDAEGHVVGKHYAGPTWELAAGGLVVGRLKAKAEASDGKGVPWLLLDVAKNLGTGVLGKVQAVQRVDTLGGKPPTEAADATKAGQERRVEYSATYLFYVAKP